MGRQEIVLNARSLGPRLGPKMKKVLNDIRLGEAVIRGDGFLEGAGEIIEPHEFELRIIAEAGHACISDGGLFACLDLTVDHELALEGFARDVIRLVQNARREADLVPDDRISLGLIVKGDLKEAIEKHEEFIKAEVLATDLHFDEIPDTIYSEEVEIQGEDMVIHLGKK